METVISHKQNISNFILKLIFFIGTVRVFQIYAVVCGVILILFILVNFYNRNEGGISADLPDSLDPKTVSIYFCSMIIPFYQ